MTQRRSWEKFQCQVRHDWGGDDRLMVKPSSLLLIILCTLNSLAFFSDTQTGWFPIWTLNNYIYCAMIFCLLMSQNYFCTYFVNFSFVLVINQVTVGSTETLLSKSSTPHNEKTHSTKNLVIHYANQPFTEFWFNNSRVGLQLTTAFKSRETQFMR